jgi:hypothetical protein
VSRPRVVRNRTKPDETAFDVVQASSVVMTITIRESPLASSPGLRWSVSLEVAQGSRGATLTRVAETVEAAFFDAADALAKLRPRGHLPSFSLGEWALIRDGLRGHGVL